MDCRRIDSRRGGDIRLATLLRARRDRRTRPTVHLDVDATRMTLGSTGNAYIQTILKARLTPSWGITGRHQATPNTHFVMLAQAILYRGAGFSAAWPQFLSLAVIGAAMFILRWYDFGRP